MRRFIITAAAAAMLVLALAPAAAAKDPMPDPQVPLVGTFVDTFTDGATKEIAANTPFYVENAWCGFANERVILLSPTTRVGIALDGKPLVMGTIVDMHFVVPGVPECLYGKMNYHNFRVGLPAGTYTFDVDFYWLGENQYHATTTLTVH
jgi:hypothetical protein